MAKIKNHQNQATQNITNTKPNAEEIVRAMYKEGHPRDIASLMLKMYQANDAPPLVNPVDVNKAIDDAFSAVDKAAELRAAKADAIDAVKENFVLLGIKLGSYVIKYFERKVNKCDDINKIDRLMIRIQKEIDRINSIKANIAEAYSISPIVGQLVATQTYNYYSAIAEKSKTSIHSWMGEFGPDELSA